MASVVPDSTETLVTEVLQATSIRYVAVGSFIALVYDILITMDLEIRLIWPARFSLVKALYFINRYCVPGLYLWNIYMTAGFATSIPNEMCYRWFLASTLFQSLSVNGVGAALILLRVYALSGRSLRVLIVLLCLFCATLVINLTIAVYSTTRSQGEMQFLPFVRTCYVSRVYQVWILWVPMIVYDTTVLTLIVRKIWYHVKQGARTPLLALFLRDGIMYYMVMLIVEVSNLMLFAFVRDSLWVVGLGASWCLPVIMISRLYLNLRNVASHDDWSTATSLRRTAKVPRSPLELIVSDSESWSLPALSSRADNHSTDDWDVPYGAG